MSLSITNSSSTVNTCITPSNHIVTRHSLGFPLDIIDGLFKLAMKIQEDFFGISL